MTEPNDDTPLKIKANDPRVVALAGEYSVAFSQETWLTTGLVLSPSDVARLLTDIGCDDLDYPEDDLYDAIVIKAGRQVPSDVCASCCGYDREWSRDVGSLEAENIVNGEGNTIWENSL